MTTPQNGLGNVPLAFVQAIDITAAHSATQMGRQAPATASTLAMDLVLLSPLAAEGLALLANAGSHGQDREAWTRRTCILATILLCGLAFLSANLL